MQGGSMDGPGEDEAMMEQWAAETGYQGGDPAEAMAHVWAKMPTDHVAEVIDRLSAKHGIPPPFGNQGGGMMKAGGPANPALGKQFGPDEFNSYQAARSWDAGADPFMSHYDAMSGRQPFQRESQPINQEAGQHLDKYMSTRSRLPSNAIRDRR
jgi:hypothetical protein